jgi:hypothetical protein
MHSVLPVYPLPSGFRIPKKRTLGSSISNDWVFPTPEDEERFAPMKRASLLGGADHRSAGVPPRLHFPPDWAPICHALLGR